MDDSIRKEINDWREKLDANLSAEYSWLSLIGLQWLKPGKNTIGCDINADIKLPRDKVPAEVGYLTLADDGQVVAEFSPAANVTMDDKPVDGELTLQPDTSAEPTFLYLNDLRFVFIDRGERYGIRIWDKANPARTNFSGRIWYDIDPAMLVEAHFTTYDEPKMVDIPNVIGDVQQSPMDGKLEFTLQGQPCSLDVMSLPDGDYYILFTDLSNGKGTYPSGRFLVTEVAEDDRVVIDFNKAYNPPCAFTAYATCPIPPKDNHINVTVQAGERYQGADRAVII